MEPVTLIVGIVATILVVYWMTKKVFKLAIYAGIAAVVAWFWYTQLG